MAGVGRLFNTEENHPLGIHLREHINQSPKVVVSNMFLVAIDEHLPQPCAVFLLDTIPLVGFLLLVAYFLGGRQLFQIGVADANLRKPLLQPLAVHESILASTQSSPLPDIAEGVDTILDQLAEKLLFGGVVYPKCEDFHHS